MKITENFTLEELTHSAAANAHKVDNSPNDKETENLIKLAKEILQPIRDKFKKPIIVNSGFRSPKVNKLVGGSATSAHLLGYAADLAAKDMAEFQKCVLDWAKTNKFDQIIIEYPTKYVASWIHIGLQNCSGQQRKQILYCTNGKYYPITEKHYLK